MSRPFLSVVIPCFNEEDRLGGTLEKVLAHLRTKSYSWEVIVVDDGSRDRTGGIAQEKLVQPPHRILRSKGNQGKGAAVKQGMLEGKGEYVLFSDADLSTPIEEADRLIARLRDGFDIAIGSRALRESQVEVHQNLIRETMGKIFNRIARLVSFKGIYDSQCGFKCFRRGVAQDLFQKQKIRGFSFDAEILYLAQKKGYRIAEVPVVWRNSPQSRVRIVWDSFWMLLDVLRIRFLHP